MPGTAALHCAVSSTRQTDLCDSQRQWARSTLSPAPQTGSMTTCPHRALNSRRVAQRIAREACEIREVQRVGAVIHALKRLMTCC